MTTLQLKVDRVEEGFAVCYHPDGGMTDVALPDGITVRDGDTVEVVFDGDTVISVKVVETDDPKSEERRTKLDRLFGRK